MKEFLEKHSHFNLGLCAHIKFKHPQEYQSIYDITSWLSSNCTFAERIYCILNDITEPVKCKECDNEVKFERKGRGYREFCSIKCSRNSPLTQSKYQRTCIDRYGTDNPSKSDTIVNKIKSTKLERYGDENYNNIERFKNTCMDKYGAITPLENNEIKNKIKSTKLERYGDENYNNREKMMETKLENGSELYIFPTIGLNEKQLLDEVEQQEDIVIDRDFKVGKYFPDGYCHETNTIYEVYEQFHHNQVEEDLKRQKDIQDKLGCQFVVIWDESH